MKTRLATIITVLVNLLASLAIAQEEAKTSYTIIKNGTVPDLESTTWEEIGARAAAFAQEMLANGFTTIRDLGGAHVGLKKVIDEGLLPGPRIYTAGAFISQTSGHGDYGTLPARKSESNLERLEFTRLADGRDEVLAASRRNIRLGAHFLKVMMSGGVSSIMDPIYDSQKPTMRSWPRLRLPRTGAPTSPSMSIKTLTLVGL